MGPSAWELQAVEAHGSVQRVGLTTRQKKMGWTQVLFEHVPQTEHY